MCPPHPGAEAGCHPGRCSSWSITAALDRTLPVQILNPGTSEHPWSSGWGGGRKPCFPSTVPAVGLGGGHPAPLLSPKPIVLLPALDHTELTQI